jgi:hypothetical protein
LIFGELSSAVGKHPAAVEFYLPDVSFWPDYFVRLAKAVDKSVFHL